MTDQARIRVLFICGQNSARSQMAEAFLSKFGGGAFTVESAGLEPADKVNPLVVEVMREEGIDLSDKKPQAVFRLFRDGRLYDYVITVCDKETERRCPVFPGVTRRLHWPFPDPAAFTGTLEERLEKTRRVRDRIKERMQNPLAENSPFMGL